MSWRSSSFNDDINDCGPKCKMHSILFSYFSKSLKICENYLSINGFFKFFNNVIITAWFFWNYRMEAEILEATTQELMMHDYPSDCCPEGCYLRFPCLAGDPDSPFWQGWGNLRIKTFRLIENKYFEMAVITMILISSLALVSMYLYLCT